MSFRVHLLRRADSVFVAGTIRSTSLSDKMLWTRWHEEMPADAEDGHWEWDQFIDLSLTFPNQIHIAALELASQLQGLMWLDLTTERSEGWGYHIARVSTAPWNRPPDSVYRGVGSILIASAIFKSLHDNRDGRIYLESLPGAEDYYRRCGMQECGRSDEEHLLQFRFDPEGAWDFVMRLEREGYLDAGS